MTAAGGPPVPSATTESGAIVQAALWMGGSIVSFSVMAVAGRVLSAELDTFEIMLWRSITGCLIVWTVLSATGGWGRLGGRLGLHAVRNVAHFTGQNLWFYAITAAPLAQVFAVEFTSPIWALLLAPLLLSERLTRTRAAVAAVGFAGVLIVARPGYDMAPGVPFAALAALFFAVTGLLTRRLTRDQPLWTILFWLTGFQTVFGLVCAGYDGDIAVPRGETWAWAVGVGVAGLVAHLSLTRALALAPAAVVMPIDFARLPVIALVGMWLYGEPLGWPLVVGAALILSANWYGLRAESRRITPVPL